MSECVCGCVCGCVCVRESEIEERERELCDDKVFVIKKKGLGLIESFVRPLSAVQRRVCASRRLPRVIYSGGLLGLLVQLLFMERSLPPILRVGCIKKKDQQYWRKTTFHKKKEDLQSQ